MTDHFHHVGAETVPAVIEESGPTLQVVHFLTIHEDLPLSRRDRPNDNKLVLLATAIGACFPLVQSGFIRETEPPSDATLAGGKMLS